LKRESGTARLEEAARAFRSALLGFTRGLVPLGWAMTQNNLGTLGNELDGPGVVGLSGLNLYTNAFANITPVSH